MAPLFGRVARKAKALDAAREQLRAEWEIHMVRMHPHESPKPEFVEYRALAAEFDVRASRFIGAVIAGHADGLHAPDGVEELREGTLRLPERNDAEADEVWFFIDSSFEVERLLDEAIRIQKLGTPR